MLIDTHCHLNLTEHYPDPGAEVEFARKMGVERLVVIGIDIDSSLVALELAERFDEIYAVVGIHPNHAATYEPTMVHRLESLLQHPKAVAIGEIGLDYHWDYATREQQYGALRDQLALADHMSAPVVFHCREAYGDLLDVLEQRMFRPNHPGMLLHCFAGDREDARRAVELNCYFGVDGPLTFKSAVDFRELVKSLPRDRIVIETDSPYLTPVPFRGKPNRPGYVAYVSNMLASLWELSTEESAAITTENALRFFGQAKLGVSSPIQATAS